jgi:two-component system CheB/CheR fusion protein
VDLNEILKDVVKDFDLSANHQSIRSENLPVVKGIPLQMKQLFHNLISNALKFRQDDKKTLNLEISSRLLSREDVKQFRNLTNNKSYSEILFKDNGMGFNQKYAEQIFVIFKRLHEKSRYPGTGIGLALCRKITDNHEGHIYAESEEGKGSIFHVILPVAN